MLDYIDPEAQHFIDCITLMFKTTSPMLYIPPGLLRQIGAKVWRDHVEAWDGIFNQGRTQRTTRMNVFRIVWIGIMRLTILLFENLKIIFFWCISGPLHPEHLQAVTSGDWQSKEIPRSPG